ncbi:hypothetical protein PINS_up010484 [Pythium insidiosum]|nr:hypothetical protein PINS_up010484 [Pythium insidiosum]
MQGLVSASLLTIVVVASVAAAGWLRKHRAAISADGTKKKDEDAVETPVEIVVEETKKVSKEPRANKTSLTTELMSFRLPPELVNRRQYVKAICDRFESLANKAMENSSLRDGLPRLASSNAVVPDNSADSTEETTVQDPCDLNYPQPVVGLRPAAEVASAISTSAQEMGHRAKNKLNNLSSFVRQCVSNIERTQLAPPVIPNHMVPSARASISSNQSEATSQQQLKQEYRVPSLVTETDVEPSLEDPEDDEPAAVKRPLLVRQPSTDNNRLAPKRSLDCAFSASPTPMPPRPKSARANRTQAEDESSSNQSTALVSASLEKAPEADPATPEAPPEPRKSLAGKLQQFQQLVPSNQARSSMHLH